MRLIVGVRERMLFSPLLLGFIRSNNMNAKELAAVLNGLSYKSMVPPGVIEGAKQDRLIIVWGTEGDTIEFSGALFGSVPCYDGCIIYLDNVGIIKNECSNEDCPYFLEKIKYAVMLVKGHWCATSDYTWTCATNVPCEGFDVFQDGEKYCRGIVFKSPFP